MGLWNLEQGKERKWLKGKKGKKESPLPQEKLEGASANGMEFSNFQIKYKAKSCSETDEGSGGVKGVEEKGNTGLMPRKNARQ